jgi:hypothetical protein
MKKSPKAPAYRNPKLTPDGRTKDLLARMTLEEKAAQMICVWREKSGTLVDAGGQFDPAKASAAFKKGHGLGQVVRLSDAGQGLDARQMAEVANAIQRFFLGWRLQPQHNPAHLRRTTTATCSWKLGIRRKRFRQRYTPPLSSCSTATRKRRPCTIRPDRPQTDRWPTSPTSTTTMCDRKACRTG